MNSLFIFLIFVALICFLLSWIIPNTFSPLFRNKFSKGKIRFVFGLSIIAFFVLFGITSDLQPSQKNNSNKAKNNLSAENENKQIENADSVKNQPDLVEKDEQIKYKAEREKALNLLLDYKVQEDQYEDEKGNIIKPGATIEEVFRLQIASDLIQKTDGWFVVKDNDRYVAGWRGMRLSQFQNNPQWSIKGENIFALNGTAKKYTPELGEVSFQEGQISNEAKFYLEWEALMENDDWDDSKNQVNLDKVAKKWKLSSEEADRMFITGQSLKDSGAKERIDSMGGILTDEQVDNLLDDQGLI